MPIVVAHRLLESVVAIADDVQELAERRRAILSVLAELIQADAGFWAWGCGSPIVDSVTPIAVLDFGLTDEQRAILYAWGLADDATHDFTHRIFQQMPGRDQKTTLWPDIYSASEWAAMPGSRAHLAKGGWSSWLHSLRCSASDTWSTLFLLRRDGAAEFGQADAKVVDLAMASISWLHATPVESLPPETLAGLTIRQRTVMRMLLDGSSRKVIGRQLGISEDTVGDHLKLIYTHFGVTSSIELAALFLRNR